MIALVCWVAGKRSVRAPQERGWGLCRARSRAHRTSSLAKSVLPGAIPSPARQMLRPSPARRHLLPGERFTHISAAHSPSPRLLECSNHNRHRCEGCATPSRPAHDRSCRRPGLDGGLSARASGLGPLAKQARRRAWPAWPWPLRPARPTHGRTGPTAPRPATATRAVPRQAGEGCARPLLRSSSSVTTKGHYMLPQLPGWSA